MMVFRLHEGLGSGFESFELLLTLIEFITLVVEGGVVVRFRV
jgi:hypothetical protein